MQQRQLRLGDILDDYCPRERRLTNHAVVAMVGEDVKQTRCTTCDAEHEYKHAKVPRQRRKSESAAALFTQVAAGRPKRIPHEQDNGEAAAPPAPPAIDLDAAREIDDEPEAAVAAPEAVVAEPRAVVRPVAPAPIAVAAAPLEDESEDEDELDAVGNKSEEGPVHRPLIRATLPRQEGQPPPQRQSPDFTIRQPGGRPNRFRPRQQRSGQPFFGNRQNGNVGNSTRGGNQRQGGGNHPQGSIGPRGSRRQGQGRKRSK